MNLLAKYTSRKLVVSILAALTYALGRYLGASAADTINFALCLLSFVFVEGAGDLISRLFTRKPAVEDGARQPKDITAALENQIKKEWNADALSKTDPVR
jgi:thiosulfate reductase cytochrome b subunit